MTKDEALKLALEALRRSRKSVSGDLDLAGCAYGSNDPDGHRYDDAKKALTTLENAITAIKEALAQPEQEPVAYLCENAVGHKYFRWKKPSSTYKPVALYIKENT